MAGERRVIVINEKDLNPADLEPSDEFARLLARQGDRIGIGKLGLGAIRTLVQERAAVPQEPTTQAQSSELA